jgi:hypothetical protein
MCRPRLAPIPRLRMPEDVFRGPRWGGFWPDEFAPEWDLQYAELQPTKDDLRADHVASIDRKAGPFVVCADSGRIIESYSDRWRAVGLLNRNPAAAFVLQDGTVVARREDADVRICQRIVMPELAATA